MIRNDGRKHPELLTVQHVAWRIQMIYAEGLRLPIMWKQVSDGGLMAITSLRGSCKCLYSDACMSPFHEAALVCLPIVADLTDLPLSCLPSRLLGGLRLRGKTRRNTSPPAAAKKGAVDVESRNIARLPKATLGSTSYQSALVIGGDGSQAGRRGRHRRGPTVVAYCNAY